MSLKERMNDWYFEIEDPDGEKTTLGSKDQSVSEASQENNDSRKENG